MNIMVDIITGFLGSGKTRLINNLLENSQLSKENIIVIQCESGKTKISPTLIETGNILIKYLYKEDCLDYNYINELIKTHKVDRIIMEVNGMNKLADILNTFYSYNFTMDIVINKIFHTTNVATFDIFMANMGKILGEQISNSDYIILTNMDGLSSEKLKSIRRSLKSINNSAKVVTSINCENKLIVNDKGLYNNSPFSLLTYFNKVSDKLLIVFFLLLLVYFLFSIFKPKEFELDILLSWLQGFNTIFLGVLIEALPFILLGVFMSSIIQVFVSSETITKFFPKNSVLGFIIAIFSGLLFPVCDCAVIPVGTRLIKKGVPLPVAVTFILSAPIINPIVILSTLYAFPNQHYIVLCRIFLGIGIALLCGLIFKLFPQRKTIFLNNMDNLNCNCSFCNDNYENKNGIFQKLNTIFNHACSEFFMVGKFIIMGAFLSTIMNTTISKYIFKGLGGSRISLLLIMMLLAFILSLCSTSDAFIAKTFISQFPMYSILGFLVFGPMIDIKNMFMLLGTFKKEFVIKLSLVVFCVSFMILSLLTMLF